MKVNEIVYYCLDAIKAFSDDASVNEDHVLFLLGKYRGMLLQQYHNIKKTIPDSNYQTVCLNMESADSMLCSAGPELISKERIPDLIPLGKPSVLLFNGFESEVIEVVPFARLKAVGWNKWKKNFVYAALGPDHHLYMSSVNPQAKYLTSVKLRGIFEDYEKALDLACDEEGDAACDPMEREFPMEVSLIPELIARVVKDILGVAWRPGDQTNNANDDLNDIATFVRRNMKSQFAKQIEGED